MSAASEDPAHPAHPAAQLEPVYPVDLVEVADVLVILEEFLLYADAFVIDELMTYTRVRPNDPHAWICWVADLLGTHAATLRTTTLTPGAVQPADPPIGAPR